MAETSMLAPLSETLFVAIFRGIRETTRGTLPGVGERARFRGCILGPRTASSAGGAEQGSGAQPSS
jgi:hypothetical protein